MNKEQQLTPQEKAFLEHCRATAVLRSRMKEKAILNGGSLYVKKDK